MLFSAADIDEARAKPIAEKAGVKLTKEGPTQVGDCPLCGCGRGDDRFIIWPKDNRFYCRRCGEKGDVIKLMMLMHGYEFPDAVGKLLGREGSGAGRPREPTPEEIARRKEREEQRRRDEAVEAARAAKNDQRAAEIVAGMRPLIGTPGEAYLSEVRKIDVGHWAVRRALGTLGWHDRAYVYEPDPAEPLHPFHGQHLGAIIAILTDPVTSERTGGITRTYLHEGAKVCRAKSLGGRGRMGVVRLSPDEDVLEGLHVCEGLESGLSWMMMGFVPMWAAGSKDAMAAFPVLDGVECLTTLADNDESGGGLEAAREVRQRWAGAGREARIWKPKVTGEDGNDIIRRRAPA